MNPQEWLATIDSCTEDGDEIAAANNSRLIDASTFFEDATANGDNYKGIDAESNGPGDDEKGEDKKTKKGRSLLLPI